FTFISRLRCCTRELNALTALERANLKSDLPTRQPTRPPPTLKVVAFEKSVQRADLQPLGGARRYEVYRVRYSAYRFQSVGGVPPVRGVRVRYGAYRLRYAFSARSKRRQRRWIWLLDVLSSEATTVRLPRWRSSNSDKRCLVGSLVSARLD